jgi:alanine dehydrogenase
MIIGVPKEIKNNEFRVAVTPGGVYDLTSLGHEVYVQENAGLASGYGNKEYVEAGADILKKIDEVYDKVEIVIKVKEPTEKEYRLIKKDHILFCYLHLASNKKLAETLLSSGSTCIAYETIEKNGKFPLLAPMSEVAGRASILEGAHYLGSQYGGKGLLIGGVSGVLPGKVLILGAGIAAKSAAKMASGLGAEVIIMSPFIEELREIELGNYFNGNVFTKMMSNHNILEEIKKADLVISAVYIKGARTPILVTRKMVAQMKPGSVIVSIDIDQGSSIETARPTTHKNPIYIEEDVVHYCVANMPGIYPKTSTLALTNLTLPYIKKIASNGFDIVIKDPELFSGLNIHNSKICYRKIAEDLDLMDRFMDHKSTV